MKTAIACVIALLAGLGAGLWFGMAKVNAIRADLETAESAAAETRERIVDMERALSARAAEIEQLRGELAQVRSASRREPAAETPRPESPQSLPEGVDFFAELAQALGEEGPQPERRGSRFGGGFDRTPQPEGEPGESREDRRSSYMDEYRQRMNDFLDAHRLHANDPAEKQRIASIGEYMQSLMDQRRLLRDAQTDEEREAIFDTMRQNGEVLRSMVAEQQDQVMRDSLARQGVTSRTEQDAIIAAYKEAQDDPFFSGPFTFFGGGGYGMRGRGGPPGGYGRGRQ